MRALLRWYDRNARDLPWRRSHDPYAIWISEIMLQQTQVATVRSYWTRWMHALPTIESAASASATKIHKLWEGLGYYSRVRNLQKAAQVIVKKHGGTFPEHFDDVLALPGIGRYTAGAICSIAFNQPTPILDGNVIRVLTRIFGISKNPREKETNARLWKLAEELVMTASEQKNFVYENTRPELLPLLGERAGVRASAQHKLRNTCSHFNQSLMELGALICTPRQPKCSACPVQKHCVAFREGRQEQLPNLGKRSVAAQRRFVAFVVERRGSFLVRQRPSGVVNAHLWEFPNVEIGAAEGRARHSVRAAGHRLGFKLIGCGPLCTIKHSITRYRITLDAYRASFGGTRYTSPKLNGIWLSPAQLRKLAFTAAHKKILSRLKTASK